MKRVVTWLVALLLVATPVLAVDEEGLFELDGNAVQDAAPPPDDWALLYGGGGDAKVFTGINADPAPISIFKGGNKDIIDIPGLGWLDGSVPDKSDITNAYAAAYLNDLDELIIYFGADRVANNGDTFMGFWFYKDEVKALPDGTFSGQHQYGDTLVLVNFPQASNAVPLIQVVIWDANCKKADSSKPVAGQCAAKNLRLIAGVEGEGAICNGTPGYQDACAITNDFTETAPWPYLAKTGETDFPFESFFEGGINMSKLVGGGDLCFSSFLAETRSSSSFTAQSKDFVLDAFPLCSIAVTKQCTNGRLSANEDAIIYDITGGITNDGFGRVYNIGIYDVPPFDPGTLVFNGDPSSQGGGATLDYSATITVPLAENGRQDQVFASADSAPGGGTALYADAQATCPVITVNPALSVSKSCWSIVKALGDPLRVTAEVKVAGQVCNTGDSRIFDVTVVDDKIGTVFGPALLLKGECQPFSGGYFPTAAKDLAGVVTEDPTKVVFTDTVTASGVDIFGYPVLPEPTAMATCPLCVDEPCE